MVRDEHANDELFLPRMQNGMCEHRNWSGKFYVVLKLQDNKFDHRGDPTTGSIINKSLNWSLGTDRNESRWFLFWESWIIIMITINIKSFRMKYVFFYMYGNNYFLLTFNERNLFCNVFNKHNNFLIKNM